MQAYQKLHPKAARIRTPPCSQRECCPSLAPICTPDLRVTWNDLPPPTLRNPLSYVIAFPSAINAVNVEPGLHVPKDDALGRVRHSDLLLSADSMHAISSGTDHPVFVPCRAIATIR